MISMKTVDIINLGCSKNLVDAESLFTQLRSNGLKVRLNPNVVDAQVVIVNTCGFIEDAKAESIESIIEATGYKHSGKTEKVIVMGCLSQRYKSDLKKEIPEVDAYYGVSEIPKIVRDLGLQYQQDKVLDRLHTTSPHYAYLKIAEGCDRACSFCAIPGIRGKQISQPIENLLKEANFLVNHGAKELILISQELTRYGMDIYKKPALVQLLIELEKIEGLEWIRLHYTYPNLFHDELIQQIAQSKNICHYLDIPFQHFDDSVLEKMRRGHSREDALELIRRIRKAIPDIAIRTTILLGHPGETEEAFNNLMKDLKQICFDRLGVFTYSHEEGTHAFENFDDDIPASIKRERADAVMMLQQNISLETNSSRIGSIQKVLIDKEEDDLFIGRTQYDSPEIDNEVLIKKEGQALITGSFFDIKITDASEFDLHGELLV